MIQQQGDDTYGIDAILESSLAIWQSLLYLGDKEIEEKVYVGLEMILNGKVN